MKNYINKSAKRILSLALALIMLAGCLFTANVGVGITAAAETVSNTDYSDWNIQYWDGNKLSGYWAADTTGEYAGKYVIRTAAQLHYAVVGARDQTSDKTFVIDKSIKAFIMQPESVVDKIGIKYFIEATSGEDTRILFEEKFAAASATPVNWSKDAANYIFNGVFDGNGVGIYGLYVDALETDAQAAAFLHATCDIDGDANTNIKIEELVIKNSYFKGYYRVSILNGCAWSSGTKNNVLVDSCIFANCYLLGQNYRPKQQKLNSEIEYGNYGESGLGVIAGSVENGPIQLSNSLVYGNKTEYDTYERADDNTIKYVSTTEDAFNWLFKNNSNNGDYYGSVRNCVIFDAVVTTLKSADYCSDVYSNLTSPYTVTKIFDINSTKGSAGMYWLKNLSWDADWFAVEGELPSPFMPDNYDSSITASTNGYDGGSGTKDDPYIISSADQLYQMVTEQSYTEVKQDVWENYKLDGENIVSDTPRTENNYISKYYKVADGVDAIYINRVETKAAAKALFEKGSYSAWNPSNTNANGAFAGNFDGNGVTIYGMISTSTGFVNKIDGSDAAIKNVHFKAAYVSTKGKAAIITTDFANYGGAVSLNEIVTDAEGKKSLKQTWVTKNSVYTISNIAVTDSHIETTVSNSGKAAANYEATAGGIISIAITPPLLKIENCLFDGGTCTLIDGDDSASNYSANSSKAGIVSSVSSTAANNWEISNCVAIGASVVSMQSGGTYGRYGSNSAVKINTVYGVYNDSFSSASLPKLEDYETNGKIAADKTTFSMLDMPQLNWGGAWELTNVDDNGDGTADRSIPMLKLNGEIIKPYSQQLAEQNNGRGATLPMGNRTGGYTAGTYGMYEAFLGSGTKKDPYIISNALDLARAIACGGKDITTKLYYKLSCDIDVGATWITDAVTVAGKYQYVPFEGHIDGDGHTIYNLYAVGENASLIPQIKGGASIKNLHIRNSSIVVGSDVEGKGAFFGQLVSGGKESKVTMEGCSFEGAGVTDGVKYLTGNLGGTIIKNSYQIAYNGQATYYIDFDHPDTQIKDIPTVDNAAFYGEEGVTDPVWYKGGAEGSAPKLVNRAKAMAETDVSGLGENDYSSNDLTALRQRLLGNEAYKNIYGDVSRNGVTNLSDLAILGRQLVGSYNKIADGFWRNAALGNIVIYYGENDNYDFARKLELTLEGEFGKDVKKVVVGASTSTEYSYGSESGGLYVHKNDIYFDGTNYYKFSENASTGAITPVQINDAAEIAKYALDGKCQIVVGDVTGYTSSLGVNDYKINVDNKNSAIELQGGSFTAVEQATLDFINNSNPDTNTLYEVASGTLNDNKKEKTVGTTKYYYAWGDEFDGDTLVKDNWNYDPMHSESTSEDKSFTNLEVAYHDDIEQLYTVDKSTGRLTIWRGYYGSTTEGDKDLDGDGDLDVSWGYKNLGTQRTDYNAFGSNIIVESDDKYVTAGKIVTNKSMLAKQGYLEMKAYYPEDGHAFPCWWLVGYSGGTTTDNRYISETLFGKVFKLNNKAAYSSADNAATYAYDGTTTAMNSSKPSTFKYQLPHASYEIDIAEFMQTDTAENKTRTIKDADYTFHKFYGCGIYTNDSSDKAIKFINWDSLLSANSILSGNDAFIGLSGKVNRSGNYASYTYSYSTSDADKIYEFYPEKERKLASTWSGSGTNRYKTWDGGMKNTSTDQGHYFSKNIDEITIDGGVEYIFGVEWDATNKNALYTFTIHKANADGTKGEQVGNTITVKDDIQYTEDTSLSSSRTEGFLENLSKVATDQETANQYMYMLIQNTYYTANDDGTVYSDMLTQDNSDPKIAKMEIDYVRVYQKDGRRDIVTPDTEEFNNGSHFGY